MDLETLTRDLHALRDNALRAIEAARDPAEMDAIQLQYLGKKGELTTVLRGIGGLPAEDRPRVGAVANEVRAAVEAALRGQGTALRGSALETRLAAEAVDVTAPGRPIRRGSLHPINETVREIAQIFDQFGFVVYEGPEIEDDLTNFQMLNIPPDHPARDLWDTLYVDVEGHLLRTHTSPGQIRVMQAEKPPIRALLPGRCFRYEAIDASHASEFFQVEGLMVDQGTTMADLKGLLDQFAGAMFGRAGDAVPAGLLPVHRAVGGLRRPVRRVRRRRLPGLQQERLDDDPRRGHGPSGGAALRRPGPRGIPGLRVRDGRGAHLEPAPLRGRPALLHGQRPAIPRAIPMKPNVVLGFGSPAWFARGAAERTLAFGIGRLACVWPRWGFWAGNPVEGARS